MEEGGGLCYEVAAEEEGGSDLLFAAIQESDSVSSPRREVSSENDMEISPSKIPLTYAEMLAELNELRISVESSVVTLKGLRQRAVSAVYTTQKLILQLSTAEFEQEEQWGRGLVVRLKDLQTSTIAAAERASRVLLRCRIGLKAPREQVVTGIRSDHDALHSVEATFIEESTRLENELKLLYEATERCMRLNRDSIAAMTTQLHSEPEALARTRTSMSDPALGGWEAVASQVENTMERTFAAMKAANQARSKSRRVLPEPVPKIDQAQEEASRTARIQTELRELLEQRRIEEQNEADRQREYTLKGT